MKVDVSQENPQLQRLAIPPSPLMAKIRWLSWPGTFCRRPLDLLSWGLLFSEIIPNDLRFRGPSPILLDDAAYSELNLT